MSYKNKEQKQAYDREWYHRRRQEAIEYLGGKCIQCLCKDKLHFDHINPKTKLFAIGDTNRIYEEFWNEVKKCQLLCEECHRDKHTTKEHGTTTMYRHACRCELCRKAVRDYNRKLKQTKKLAFVTQPG